MNFKLFVLALAGSAYGLSKVEECVKDKCPTMDQTCITDCALKNLTTEQFGTALTCFSKCTNKSQDDPCTLGCVSKVLNSSGQQTNGTTTDGGTKTDGNKNSGAVAVIAKSTAFAWIAVVGLNYIL